jgi:signal peptidase II
MLDEARPTARRYPGPNQVRVARFAFAAAAGVVAAGIDQASKAEALHRLSTEDRIPLIGDLLGLQLAFNAGTVMSLGSSSTWVFTLLGAVAVVVVPVLMARAQSLVTMTGLGLIWGGAAGNFIDRLAAPPGLGMGRVTDFLAYGDLFVGNVADVFLVVGVVIVMARLAFAARPERQIGVE